jgi:hypothetical protein
MFVAHQEKSDGKVGLCIRAAFLILVLCLVSEPGLASGLLRERRKIRIKHAVWRTVRSHGRRSSNTILPSARSNFKPFKGLEFFHRIQLASFSTL